MATPTGGAADAGTDKRDRIRLGVEIIGGLVAIGALVFGFVQQSAATNASTTVNNQQETINNYNVSNSSLESAYSVLSSSYDALQTELLSAQAAATKTVTVAPTATTGSGSAGAVGTVYHSDPLIMVPTGGAANLDAPPTDHGWTRDVQNGFPDIDFSGQGISSQAFSQIKKADTGDFAACSSSGFGSTSIPLLELPIGSFICIKTSESRYAALHLIAGDSKQVTFDVVVYNK